jgi:hypothetical protein
MAAFDMSGYRKKGKAVTSEKFNIPLVVSGIEGEGGEFVYQGFRKDVGPFKSTVHTVKAVRGTFRTASVNGSKPEAMKAGEIYDFFGTGMLDKHLAGFKKGQKFAMLCQGARKMKKGPYKGKEAHVHEVVLL